MKRFIIIIFGFILFTHSYSVYSQSTIYVDVDATGLYDGTTWTNAYQSILEAIANASAGDELWVAEGTYYLHQGGANGDTALWLKTDVDIYGGFAGGETLVTERDNSANITIIDGYDVTETKKVGHVVIANNVTNCTLDGFTIQNGKANASSLYIDKTACQSAENGVGGTSASAVLVCAGGGNGGGILINQADPVIQNCTITKNEAGKGAGAYIMVATNTSNGTYPSPSFINCIISDNSASKRGAGVSLDLWTNPEFINCQFLRNTCYEKGGALYLDWNCSPTLTNCLIAENYAVRGAGMGIDGSSEPILVHCTVVNNSSQDIGAGLYTGSYKAGSSSANTPYIINSIVWGNNTDWGGPNDMAIWHENHFYIENSLIGVGFNSLSSSAISNTDPLLVDIANSDYKLTSSSPNIDAGIGASLLKPNITMPTTDLLGTARADGQDIGAYELASTILPIKLLGFVALLEDDKVRLEWKTAAEIKNDYFVIEKSVSGIDWNEITTIDGSGNSYTIKHYKTYDVNPFLGTNYYRLKQVDFDGNFTYSNIESVYLHDWSELSLYPNPTSGNFSIKLEGGHQFATITLTDIFGKHIRSKVYNKSQMLNLNIKEPSGVYILIIEYGENKDVVRLIKE